MTDQQLEIALDNALRKFEEVKDAHGYMGNNFDEAVELVESVRNLLHARSERSRTKP